MTRTEQNPTEGTPYADQAEALAVFGTDWYCNTCAHVFAAATDPDACPECGSTDEVVPDVDEEV